MPQVNLMEFSSTPIELRRLVLVDQKFLTPVLVTVFINAVSYLASAISLSNCCSLARKSASLILPL